MVRGLIQRHPESATLTRFPRVRYAKNTLSYAGNWVMTE